MFEVFQRIIDNSYNILQWHARATFEIQLDLSGSKDLSGSRRINSDES